MVLKELHVSGYRSIRDLRLELGQLTVIAGPNGSGKTNLYRSLHLLTAAAQGALAASLLEEGGMPSALWAGQRKRGPVRMQIGVTLDELTYELSCGLPNAIETRFILDPEIKEERLWFHEARRKTLLMERKGLRTSLRDANGAPVTYKTPLDIAESMLSQLTDPARYPVVWAMRQHLANWRFYHHFRTDLDAPIRQPRVGVRTPALAHDGRDLAAALQTIIEIGDRPGLVRGVERAFPGSTLHIEGEAARFHVHLGMPALHRPLDARELSDGTLRYLCLLAALLSPRPPAFLALNEPETSIHPDLIDPLAELIAHASRASQVLVTTHSQALVERLSAEPAARTYQLERALGETQVVGAGRRR